MKIEWPKADGPRRPATPEYEGERQERPQQPQGKIFIRLGEDICPDEVKTDLPGNAHEGRNTEERSDVGKAPAHRIGHGGDNPRSERRNHVTPSGPQAQHTQFRRG